MLKKTITYNNLEGKKITDDFYFNLSKADLLRLEMSVAGGFVEHMQKMIKNNDNVGLFNEYEKLIKIAYGEKDVDNKRFIKSEALSEAFMQTDAYSELLMEITMDAKAAAEFLAAVIPDDLAKSLPKNFKDGLPEDLKTALPEDVVDALPDISK